MIRYVVVSETKERRKGARWQPSELIPVLTAQGRPGGRQAGVNLLARERARHRQDILRWVSFIGPLSLHVRHRLASLELVKTR